MLKERCLSDPNLPAHWFRLWVIIILAFTGLIFPYQGIEFEVLATYVNDIVYRIGTYVELSFNFAGPNNERLIDTDAVAQ